MDANMDANMECFIRIRLTKTGNTKGSFGPGVASLLEGVETTGSLNSAAKSMNMAYSKAWKTIGLVEEDLGWPLLERNGARGSVLTAEAKRLLATYKQMQKVASEAVDKILKNTDSF